MSILIDTSPVLSYKIELALAGKEDGELRNIDVDKKRELLRANQCAKYTLSRALLETHSTSGLKIIDRRMGEDIIVNDDRETLWMRVLPSTTACNSEIVANYQCFQFYPRGCGMKPSSDLLVSFEHSLVDSEYVSQPYSLNVLLIYC